MSIDRERYTYNATYPHLIDSIANSQNPYRRVKDRVKTYLDIYIPLDLKRGDKLLDVACGIGTLGHFLRTTGVTTYGIDINPAAIAKGKEVYGFELKSRKTVGSADFIPFSDGFFNAVVSQDLFEHLLDEEEAGAVLSEMARVCNGDKMLHEVTVKEDREWIDNDDSHSIKQPASWWADFFEKRGWRVIAPTSRSHIVPTSSGFKRRYRHGYFLLHRDQSLTETKRT
jgi:ubiquinone/menaquinone biosynthesis C-methylase UbiE